MCTFQFLIKNQLKVNIKLIILDHLKVIFHLKGCFWNENVNGMFNQLCSVKFQFFPQWLVYLSYNDHKNHNKLKREEFQCYYRPKHLMWTILCLTSEVTIEKFFVKNRDVIKFCEKHPAKFGSIYVSKKMTTLSCSF